MVELSFLLLAAFLEVAGDALIRHGLQKRGIALMVGGAAVLVAYGFMVNMTKLDFSKLMGIYIVLFFLVSQAVSVLLFRERLQLPVIVGGTLIVAGGLVMTVWKLK